MNINVATSKIDDSVLAIGEIEINELSVDYNIIPVNHNLVREFDLYIYHLKKQGDQITLTKKPADKQLEIMAKKNTSTNNYVGDLIIENAMYKQNMSEIEDLQAELIIELAMIKSGGVL